MCDMSEKRYLVVFTGKTHHGMDVATVKSNLLISLNLPGDKLDRMFCDKEVAIKHCVSASDAERIAQRFNDAGAQCYVKDRLNQSQNPGKESNSSSSLNRLLNVAPGRSEQSDNSSSLYQLISGFWQK